MNFNKILDIIIPVYNNDKDLYHTLCSLNSIDTNEINEIIIVDDASYENNNYTEIISFFSNFMTIKYYKLEKNLGPGGARQKGINLSSAEYLTFIDCGDIIATPLLFKHLMKTIMENPNIYVYSFAHLDESYNGQTVFCSPKHNRLLGKIFYRKFLDEYNITFSKENTRINEDIGFNYACRMICEHLFYKDNIVRYYEDQTPLIIWIYNKNSLTRINNHEFYYKQNEGLSANGIHAIKIAKKNKVDNKIIQKQAYEIFNTLYFNYIGSINVAPQFIEINLKGALNFYNFYFTQPDSLNQQLFLQIYNESLSNLTQDLNEPYFAKISTISIIDFLNLLAKQLSH